MPAKAFVLIEVDVGKTKAVLESLKKLKEISSVEVVTGPYDIIAVVEAPDLNAIGELVTTNIHTISGICRTITCITVKLH